MVFHLCAFFCEFLSAQSD
uniref:Uncharacterized protein n=1 Tax=Anguilla anguilla TaxID=7936 RepID=A0A0E9XGR2_ANGAN